MPRPRSLLILLLASSLPTFAACSSPVPEPTPDNRPAPPKEPEVPEPADLIKEDLKVGEGPECKDGDKVKVNYTGRLLRTNFMFDTSVGKKPFDVEIGKGGVIKGWDQGLPGMKVGGKRKLTIPSRLAYGERGSPPKIPANAPLVFEIELLSIGEVVDAGAGDAGDGGKKKKSDAK